MTIFLHNPAKFYHQIKLPHSSLHSPQPISCCHTTSPLTYDLPIFSWLFLPTDSQQRPNSRTSNLLRPLRDRQEAKPFKTSLFIFVQPHPKSLKDRFQIQRPFLHQHNYGCMRAQLWVRSWNTWVKGSDPLTRTREMGTGTGQTLFWPAFQPVPDLVLQHRQSGGPHLLLGEDRTEALRGAVLQNRQASRLWRIFI